MLSHRFVLITLVGAALGSAACSGNESSPMEPSAPPLFIEGRGPTGSTGGWGDTRPSSCKPLSPRSESRDIGPLGGELQIGPHTLIVPPGALLLRTRITGTISSDSVNSVQFAPEGLRFLLPARLQMSYANCKKIELRSMRVVYTSNNLALLLELIRSEDHKDRQIVVGVVSHFSRYAVAY